MSDATKIPPVTQELVRHVDGTPDAGYVGRILAAHLENTSCRWKATPRSAVCDMMNKNCEERTVLLRCAIRKLSSHDALVSAAIATVEYLDGRLTEGDALARLRLRAGCLCRRALSLVEG